MASNRKPSPPPAGSAGYSGTPLARKLTLGPGLRVWAPGIPAAVKAEIDAAGLDIKWTARASARLPAAHLFVIARSELERRLAALRTTLAPDGQVWVSWPKKASGVATDITEDTIRQVALPLGFVDIRVCAVDATWSGLKLVIRKALR
ncbi:MAG: DUF3052 domain-containing protein [Gemmatimonadales bacterium]|nr:DUF3052 domain-containing protein [Gemmatimonadales bacterium]